MTPGHAGHGDLPAGTGLRARVPRGARISASSGNQDRSAIMAGAAPIIRPTGSIQRRAHRRLHDAAHSRRRAGGPGEDPRADLFGAGVALRREVRVFASAECRVNDSSRAPSACSGGHVLTRPMARLESTWKAWTAAYQDRVRHGDRRWSASPQSPPCISVIRNAFRASTMCRSMAGPPGRRLAGGSHLSAEDADSSQRCAPASRPARQEFGECKETVARNRSSSAGGTAGRDAAAARARCGPVSASTSREIGLKITGRGAGASAGSARRERA